MATSALICTLFALGMAGGCMSGLLGIGGGIIMLPLLISIPELAGFHVGLRSAVGITMLQSLTGSMSSMVIHRRYDAFDFKLALVVGGSAAVGSLGGAVFSRILSERLLAILFAAMAVTSLMLLLLPEPHHSEIETSPDPVPFTAATLLGGGVGFLAGIIGQGGAFIILPLLIHVLKVPVRTAIGTTAGIAFLSALAGFLGKWGTGQVPLLWGITVALGAFAGGQLGGIASRRVSTRFLRGVLFAMVAISALRTIIYVWNC